jgi:hypothetical protein
MLIVMIWGVLIGWVVILMVVVVGIGIVAVMRRRGLMVNVRTNILHGHLFRTVGSVPAPFTPLRCTLAIELLLLLEGRRAVERTQQVIVECLVIVVVIRGNGLSGRLIIVHERQMSVLVSSVNRGGARRRLLIGQRRGHCGRRSVRWRRREEIGEGGTGGTSLIGRARLLCVVGGLMLCHVPVGTIPITRMQHITAVRVRGTIAFVH